MTKLVDRLISWPVGKKRGGAARGQAGTVARGHGEDPRVRGQEEKKTTDS